MSGVCVCGVCVCVVHVKESKVGWVQYAVTEETCSRAVWVYEVASIGKKRTEGWH